MYVKITNGTVDTYPYSVGQLRRDNPQTSFPKQIPTEMLEEYGVFAVATASMPDADPRTKIVSEATTPTLVDGAWVIGWTTTDKTAEQITEWDTNLATQNRDKRNTLLGQTDFYALSDNTMSAEMTAYRQALRDITSHANWPNLEDADWPVAP
jgi:hypothetical protein